MMSQTRFVLAVLPILLMSCSAGVAPSVSAPPDPLRLLDTLQFSFATITMHGLTVDDTFSSSSFNGTHSGRSLSKVEKIDTIVGTRQQSWRDSIIVQAYNFQTGEQKVLTLLRDITTTNIVRLRYDLSTGQYHTGQYYSYSSDTYDWTGAPYSFDSDRLLLHVALTAAEPHLVSYARSSSSRDGGNGTTSSSSTTMLRVTEVQPDAFLEVTLR
jgi:hypothetical protein